ncbi:MAG: hypothetical protein R3F62_25115 [Planctomycetota bacterium]
MVRGLRAALQEGDGLLHQAHLAELTQDLGALCVGLTQLERAAVGDADPVEVEELRAQLQVAHRELGRLEERQRVEAELRTQLRRARADTARLRAEERGHLTRTLELERARAQLEEARDELDAHRGELERLRGRLEESATQAGSRKEALHQLNTLRLSHEEQAARLRCAEFLNSELRQELESMRAERDRLLKRVQEGGPAREELAELRATLERERDQLRTDLHVLEESRRYQSRRLTRYQERIQDQEQTLSELYAELQDLRRRDPAADSGTKTDALSRAQLRAVLDNPIHRPALRDDPDEAPDPNAPDMPLRASLPSLGKEPPKKRKRGKSASF